MRLASVGSGSAGNGTLVLSAECCLLIDCGFSTRELTRRLAGLGLAPGDLTGVLLTHEHADHVVGVGALCRKFDLPLWVSAGTAQAAARVLGALPRVHRIDNHQTFVIRDLGVEPLVVPHDAREPCQFLFDDGRHRLAVVTDVGAGTPFLERSLSGLDALMLEFNHDPAMLERCAYPERTKQRIGGDRGHLSNAQAAGLLERIDTSRLQHFVAAHLSRQNNAESLVRHMASRALGCSADWIDVAAQDAGLGWRALA